MLDSLFLLYKQTNKPKKSTDDVLAVIHWLNTLLIKLGQTLNSYSVKQTSGICSYPFKKNEPPWIQFYCFGGESRQ